MLGNEQFSIDALGWHNADYHFLVTRRKIAGRMIGRYRISVTNGLEVLLCLVSEVHITTQMGLGQD